MLFFLASRLYLSLELHVLEQQKWLLIRLGVDRAGGRFGSFSSTRPVYICTIGRSAMLKIT